MRRTARDLDYPEIRRRLAGARGRHFWRGLEELAETEEFRRFLAAEFPAVAALDSDLSRRNVLRAMGASLALAGLAGCDAPPQDAVPYVEPPEEVIPGKPRFYATAVLLEGYAQPVLGETHVGRPTKLEGNLDHPMSGGATDAFTQASVLQFYDPDRSQAPTYMGRLTTWGDFRAAIVSHAARLAADDGAGLRLLTGAVTSPTLRRQLDALSARFPRARWHAHEPAGIALRHAATRLAFGRPLDLHVRLDEAAVVVSLDDDFLGPGPSQVANARGWSTGRRRAQRGEGMSRLHVAESTPSLTGAVASERLAVAAARIGSLAAGLARELGVAEPGPAADLTPAEQSWVAAAADGLRRHAGQSLLAVGAHQPADVQALGFLVNERLGNAGRTVVYTEPVTAVPPDAERSLEILARDMAAGRVETLLVLDCNPVYTAPADLRFAAAMARVPLRIHAGLYYDETAALSQWHLPAAHALESWSDARAVDGTATILQPLARPFYDVRSTHEVLAMLLGDLGASGQQIVRDTWRGAFGDRDFEARWRQVLHDGLVPDSAAPAVEVSARPLTVAPPRQPDEGKVEVVFRPDPTVWDGRFANVGWLQELPKPLTKLTWDNVVLVGPRLGEALELGNGDLVEVMADGRTATGPAWIMPGQADHTVTMFLGYGRARSGRVGEGIGYDAYRLRAAASPWLLENASIRRVEGQATLATTQLHFAMEGFDLVRVVGPHEAAKPHEEEEPQPTLYPDWNYESPSWGMAIDLDLCIGCNACVVACQAENNIPMVGKEQVAMGREMHWLRVDRYYEGGLDSPRTHFQPVPCMHCEKAPCEMGCPVYATVHGPEGLNQMVYNRCIGTRTCSSFCPYKVRRFNWYDYTGDDPAAIQAQRNPDVTVRDRGVMEKCTYCVQRISAARIEAEKENRPIRDGEVVTACQAACPTRVIVFGDIADPQSAVSRTKRSPRNYSLLEELNTRPRTTYLAKIAAVGEDEEDA